VEIPEKYRPLLKLIPLALLGGYAVGAVTGAALSMAHLEGGSLSEALLPDPLGFMLGAAAFFGLGFLLQKEAGPRALNSVYEGMLTRLQTRGFASAITGTAVDPTHLEEASLALADRIIAQAYADRKEAEKYKDALSKYSDSHLAKKLTLEKDYTELQTKKQDLAVMFADIRAFTKLCDTLRTEEVVLLLNDYFSMATEAIHKNGGRINKFIGDAVMALFEDPPDYKTGSTAVKNACNASIQLVREYRLRSRQWKEKFGRDFDTDLGCGIHYGSLIFGNMGSPERMEYSGVGDTVNFASRLCDMAAGGQIRISEICFKLVQGYFDMSSQQPITVKGKSGEFKTWLIDGVRGGMR
jgi:class 3 adenylate cyclase